MVLLAVRGRGLIALRLHTSPLRGYAVARPHIIVFSFFSTQMIVAKCVPSEVIDEVGPLVLLLETSDLFKSYFSPFLPNLV